ncbi:MAG: T9SS type A sorting domain-containing protein [Ignavibacteriaceae bacterium]
MFQTILVDAQTTQPNYILSIKTNKTAPVFKKVEQSYTVNKKVTTNFYPLKTGDFWEYIEEDTTTLFDVPRLLNFSIAREVIGDSLLPNNISYKKIKHENCANSVDKPIKYELQRVDSTGNVFIYSNNKDQLLYDFNKGIGETYSSHYLNHYWEILNKYYMIGFEDTLLATDFGLYSQNNQLEYKVTVLEKFGLVFYRGIINDSYFFPEGNFFGGILNGSTYGNLLVKKQKVDWSEFYPLHIGDFWKYVGNEGVFETIKVKSVIGDTLMPDNKIYKVIAYQKFGGPYPSKGNIFERVDSSTVMSWSYFDSVPVRNIKFSVCLGDTFSAEFPNFYFRYDDKSYSNIHYFMYPDVTFRGFYYTKDLGLYESTFEGGGYILVGAVINGIVYGDTTVTSITEKENKIPAEFKLYPNYPNPFNPVTTINYQLPKSGTVTLKIFDILGNLVKTLVNEQKEKGRYSVQFDASSLASGMYVYQIKANEYEATKKMMLLK